MLHLVCGVKKFHLTRLITFEMFWFSNIWCEKRIGGGQGKAVLYFCFQFIHVWLYNYGEKEPEMKMQTLALFIIESKSEF